MSPSRGVWARGRSDLGLGFRPRTWRVLLSAVASALWLTGCSTPVGADRVSPERAYAELSRSALHGQGYGLETRRVLHRYDAEEAFKANPAGTLFALHQRACADERRDLLYALAELNYLHASGLRRSRRLDEQRHAADYFLSSAVYAWLFLLGDGPEPPPGPLDRRLRVAADLYNRALAQGLLGAPGTQACVMPGAGERFLPPGRIRVAFTQPASKWPADEIERYLPADEFRVRGLSVRDRQSGLGAPLIAVSREPDPKRFPRRFPATALLRVTGDVRAWSAGQLQATLELHSTYESETVDVAGRTLPLETDLTAPLGYALNDSWVWKLGFAQFLSGEERIRSEIYLTQPYAAGRIPVLFVHGTMSSPVWWAEMWNTLRSDSRLRKHFQFWFYIYNTGNPVSYSAANLCDAIQRQVRLLDPEGRDPALRQMVVVGHSQGGLLTKLTATDTGDALWRAVSRGDFESLPLAAEEREALRRNYYFARLPCVSRVVFLSTPHHGSYLATLVVRGLVRRFISLPQELAQLSGEVLTLLPNVESAPGKVRGTVPTSLDGMSPKNPWLLALAQLPPAGGVQAHSIIAVKRPDHAQAGGDGVVKYKSAHVPYAASEFIVRSGHTCQGRPAVIEEVRRILLEHLRATAVQAAQP